MHTSLPNQNSSPLLPSDQTSENYILPGEQSSPNRYAEVVLNIPLNQVFHYRIPSHLKEGLTTGVRVKIPFGKRVTTGFCVGFVNIPCTDKIKDIINVIDEIPLADEVMLKITRWISFHYCCGWGEAIYAVIPPVVRSKAKEKWDTFVTCCDQISKLDHQTFAQIKTRAPKQARVLEILLEHP